MARIVKGEMIFSAVHIRKCVSCRIKDKLCNRFGENGLRSMVIVGTRLDQVPCLVRRLLAQEKRNLSGQGQ